MAIINLDRPRTVKFTLHALRKFKAGAKMPLWKIATEDPDGLTMRLFDSEVFTWTLWAGLLHEDPKLTFEATEELLQAYVDGGGGFAELIDPILDALRESGLFGLRARKDGAEPEAQAPNG